MATLVKYNSKAKSAMTLVELLVVIAIIAVLAALLLPSLTRSKATAQSIACKSNLRQLGIYLQMYLSANHCYPVNGRNDTRPASRADSAIFWTGKLAREEFGVSQPTTNFFQEGVWRCPSAVWSVSMLVGAAHGNTELLNYGYNDDRYNGNSLKAPDKMFGLQGHYSLKTKYISSIAESEVVSSSDMMAIGDGFEGNGLLQRSPIDFYKEWGNILARHEGSANVVFCDGHVESPRLKFLFEDTNADALVRWSRDHQPHGY
jgi:prepilin-type processing-associated H-X9-DG protein/prepilin-type N-terminal cleavage/methylation domain-containing protein